MNNEIELIQNIEFYYKRSLVVLSDFGGPSVYFHIQSIKEQRNHFLSERHYEMIYATLASWGMHKMGDPSITKTKMVEYDDFKRPLNEHCDTLRNLNKFRLDNSSIEEYENHIKELKEIYFSLKVSISDSTLVAHSKVLAHLLPDLVPPIDRQYTIRFFTQDDKLFFSPSGKYKNVKMPDSPNHFLAFVDYCVRIKKMFDQCNKNLFQIDPNTFNTSFPKIMDNVIMAFVKSVPKPLKINSQFDREYSMLFPSKPIKDWCNNIQTLIDAPRLNKIYSDGFCSSEVEQVISRVPRDQQAQFISALFWSVWIDQVMHYVLVEGGVVGFLQEIELYERFRSTYCFPKLHPDLGRGHLSPHTLLDNGYDYLKPNEKLLEEDKNEFWKDEVKKWLTYICRDDVIVALTSAFKEDIAKRFENKYGFLVENL